MLPFNSERQATRVRQDNTIPDKAWETRSKIIRAEQCGEHRLDNARTELQRLWKERLGKAGGDKKSDDDMTDDVLPFEADPNA